MTKTTYADLDSPMKEAMRTRDRLDALEREMAAIKRCLHAIIPNRPAFGEKFNNPMCTSEGMAALVALWDALYGGE